MIPCYLKKHIVKIKEKKDSTIGILASSTGNTNLEIYYYGDTIKIKKTPYIVDADYHCLIVGKDPITGEEFVIFDGMKHGYDAMFCNERMENVTRELKLYEYCKGKIQITLGYSIDYEDEKEEFEFNENGEVILMYGVLDWEEAKSIGFDWLSLKFINAKKEFVDMELA
jgi:hypothetical protein